MSEIKYYVVEKGKSVGGFGGKIHKEGATVKSDMFPEGNAETLVKMGYLKPTAAPKKETKDESGTTGGSKGNSTESDDPTEKRLVADLSVRVMADPEKEGELRLVSIDEVNAKEVSEELTRIYVEHNPAADKEILFGMLPLKDAEGHVKCRIVGYDDVNKSEIVDELKRLKVEHKSSDAKTVLFGLLPLSE